MFAFCIFLICILEFVNSHLLNVLTSFANATLMQAEFALAMGAIAFSKNTMRERSVLDIIFIWAVWILATDWVPYFPPMLASIETGVFVALLAWVYFRPYRFIAANANTENVCIAFYGGPDAPFLSRMASHFGFPFSSVALVCYDKAIRPSKATGTMVETNPEVLKARGYVMVDTGIARTPEIYGKMLDVIGTRTGYGIFRTKCLINLSPVLKELGSEWEPAGWPTIPALYYRQCVRNVT